VPELLLLALLPGFRGTARVSDLTALDLRDHAEAMAREAGAILREGYGRSHAFERKGRIDLVTEYDKRSEQLLLQRLREHHPNDAVLAEESGRHDRPGASTRWIIDPLDGTTNFAHSYPFFCVSIGVERDGELIAGVVHDPVRDETFATAAGAGALLNGRPIHVSEVARLEDGLLVTGFPYSVREHPEWHVPLFQAFLVRAQAVRRDGSAALNLCYLACGRFDGYWELDLNAWDVAAGTLLVREAGGMVTRYDGTPHNVEGRQILATNGQIHDAMRAVITEHGAKL
jgi:myo-inositol-1(or 4)-monophosphatase